MAKQIRRRLVRVNSRGRDQDRGWWLEKISPQGPHESSPLRSAGLAFLKSYPSRLVRHSQDATFARASLPKSVSHKIGSDIQLAVAQ
jgi:hypothetical protein